MSIFNELLSKINEISSVITKNFDEDLKKAFDCLDKFEEDFINGKGRAREKALKDKSILTTLQSINEDDVDSNKTPEEKQKRKSRKSSITTEDANIQDKKQEEEAQRPKKRSKEDIDDALSPEPRPKRNASAKAQSNISKQDNTTNTVLSENNSIDKTTPGNMVNVNLTQKLRRDDSADKNQSVRSKQDKDDEKENKEPVSLVQVKLEKISLPPEPMDLGSLPLNIAVKQETDKDGIAMPPPAAPVPRPRRALQKDKREESIDEDAGRRRNTRTTRKHNTEVEEEPAPPSAPVASSRATRASSRATRVTEADEIPKDRPKRTRGRKKVSESSIDTDKESRGTTDSGIGSPAEKPRPKRTRKAQKAAEKEPEPAQENIPQKETDASQMERHSIIIPNKSKTKANTTVKQNEISKVEKEDDIESNREDKTEDRNEVDGKKEELAFNSTVTISTTLDSTVVLPNGVYNHAPVTPKNVRNMNETVVIEQCNRETIVLDKEKNTIMDATIVLERLPAQTTQNITDDNSLLTDDDDFVGATNTPQKKPPNTQTGSAVKEKVQQFEQMATRGTRTKTRALNKKEEPAENQTPPDKVSKAALAADTLTKMNSMIFSGKTQVSSSATKPRSNIPVTKPQPASTSKLSALNKAKEAAEEFQKKEKEDARRKKEALLEAKREMQKKKREEKMAAAAAAREHAERERQAAMEAAARERMEKQAHADQGKLERLKETERKKQELARKAAETEERRRAEEQARAQRLADDLRRAEEARRKQMQEAEVMKKEAAIMAKEIEKRQKEYIEKQKMKYKHESNRGTPLKPNGHYPPPDPVYMCDGFQHLNSDSEDDEAALPKPAWSTFTGRRRGLMVQSKVDTGIVDKLFSVRAHCPDLRELFPNIERARLKRTSSAVWRTPTRPDPR